MKRFFAFGLIAAAVAMFAAAPAFASGARCTVSAADARPKKELRQKLQDAGWEVRRIKTEHGCYEVYAYDDDGNRVEAMFDPETFEMVGHEGEDDD